jgi:hypothetical protein
MCYVHHLSHPPSSDHLNKAWLGAQDRLCGLVVRVPVYRSRVRFPALPNFFLEVVGLEWGPLSLMRTHEELLGINSSGSSLKNREYGHGVHCAHHATPSIHKGSH